MRCRMQKFRRFRRPEHWVTGTSLPRGGVLPRHWYYWQDPVHTGREWSASPGFRAAVWPRDAPDRAEYPGRIGKEEAVPLIFFPDATMRGHAERIDELPDSVSPPASAVTAH
jgi:hypothetical protein